jgi:hypothetical protein
MLVQKSKRSGSGCEESAASPCSLAAGPPSELGFAPGEVGVDGAFAVAVVGVVTERHVGAVRAVGAAGAVPGVDPMQGAVQFARVGLSASRSRR